MDQFKFYFWLFVEELWNKRWAFLLMAWIFSCVGLGIVFLIPNQYQTKSSIYIDTDQLLSKVLKDTSLTLDHTVQSQAEKVRQMIYATDNLRKVLRNVNPANYNLSAEEEAKKIEEMFLALKFNMGGVSGQRDLYEISYTHKEPLIAYKTLKLILDNFIETNIRQMSSKNDRALEIAIDNLKISRKQLAQAQAELAAFKQKNLQTTATGSVLFGELERLKEIVRDYPSKSHLSQSKLTSLTSLLSQTSPKNMGRSSNTSQECDFFDIQNELTTLKAKGLTDKHPDIIHYQNVLNRKKMVCEETGGDSSGVNGTPNPAYLQIAEQISLLKSEMQSSKAEYNNAKLRISKLNTILDSRPKIMEKLRILQLNLKHASDAVRGATHSKDVIEGTIDLGRRSGLVSYDIIEEVQMPILPIKPNRLLLCVGAFLASFIGSLSYILLKFKLEQRMSTVSILREAFDLPVLGSVTAISKPNDKSDGFDKTIWFFGLFLLVFTYALILKIVTSLSFSFDFPVLMAFIDKLTLLFL